ncbi:hypothetical protein QCA50_008879 [Cerrena zonata]|uniref:Uncharacterized protein n=1 Tax=Cerrena zonata TaxID=2478898 RepID=A0AAW0G8H2_9APHY
MKSPVHLDSHPSFLTSGVVPQTFPSLHRISRSSLTSHQRKAEQRGGLWEERYEKKELQERVRLVFDRIAEEIEGSGVGKWVVLDADLDKAEVEQSVWDEVKLFVDQGGVSEPIKKLWDGTREATMVDALYI